MLVKYKMMPVRRSSAGRAQLVSLLSLLLAIIGLMSSAAGQLGGQNERHEDVCEFSFLYHQSPRHTLGEISLNTPTTIDVEITLRQSRPFTIKKFGAKQIHLQCKATTEDKIKRCYSIAGTTDECTVELDLSFSERKVLGKAFVIDARVNFLKNGSGLDFIVKQSGGAIYDVSHFKLADKKKTAIIPSQHLMKRNSGILGGEAGYWFDEGELVSFWINGMEMRRTPRVKFEPRTAPRKLTAVAFLYLNGTIQTFAVRTVTAITKSLKCKNIEDGWLAIVLLKEDPQNRMLFYTIPNETRGGAIFTLVDDPAEPPPFIQSAEAPPPSYDSLEKSPSPVTKKHGRNRSSRLRSVLRRNSGRNQILRPDNRKTRRALARNRRDG